MTTHEAARITRELLVQNGLDGWTVSFDNAKKRAGVCKYAQRTIGLSKFVMAVRTYEETHNTITHEVAHAIVGHRHGHDRIWSLKHRELGGDGKRCYDSEKVREAAAAVAAWVGTCSHGVVFPRHRQPKRLDGWKCRCAAGSSPVVWTRRRAA